MERGDRERWNKLSDNAKAIYRAMVKFSDVGHVDLNDLRMNIDLSELDSEDVIEAWEELQSRAYGHISGREDASPTFIINVPTMQTLLQSHRLTNQAPHKPE